MPAPSTSVAGLTDSEGRRHGEWREQETEAGGYKVGRYEHGKMVGVWTHFSPAGTKTGETTYRDGVKHGPWWSKLPDMQSSGTYVDGVEHGDFQSALVVAGSGFGENGRYDMGRKVGVWSKVSTGEDFAGTHIRQETYADGQIQLAVSTLNGEKREVVHFEGGEKHGKREVWHPGGKPALVEHYVAGVLHGPCREWHANGQLAREVEYRDGKETGTHKEWDEGGRLITHWVIEGTRRTVFVLRGEPYPRPGK